MIALYIQGDFKKVYPSNVSYRKSPEYFRKSQISGKRSECPLSNSIRFIMSLPWMTEQTRLNIMKVVKISTVTSCLLE